MKLNISPIMILGAIAISVLAMGAFLGCLVLAFAHGDENAKSLMVGAVIANATTAVGYWLGSSAGSRAKDERAAGNSSSHA